MGWDGHMMLATLQGRETQVAAGLPRDLVPDRPERLREVAAG
jgi:hypothetical protein